MFFSIQQAYVEKKYFFHAKCNPLFILLSIRVRLTNNLILKKNKSRKQHWKLTFYTLINRLLNKAS